MCFIQPALIVYKMIQNSHAKVIQTTICVMDQMASVSRLCIRRVVSDTGTGNKGQPSGLSLPLSVSRLPAQRGQFDIVCVCCQGNACPALKVRGCIRAVRRGH